MLILGKIKEILIKIDNRYSELKFEREQNSQSVDFRANTHTELIRILVESANEKGFQKDGWYWNQEIRYLLRRLKRTCKKLKDNLNELDSDKKVIHDIYLRLLDYVDRLIKIIDYIDKGKDKIDEKRCSLLVNTLKEYIIKSKDYLYHYKCIDKLRDIIYHPSISYSEEVIKILVENIKLIEELNKNKPLKNTTILHEMFDSGLLTKENLKTLTKYSQYKYQFDIYKLVSIYCEYYKKGIFGKEHFENMFKTIKENEKGYVIYNELPEVFEKIGLRKDKWLMVEKELIKLDIDSLKKIRDIKFLRNSDDFVVLLECLDRAYKKKVPLWVFDRIEDMKELVLFVRFIELGVSTDTYDKYIEFIKNSIVKNIFERFVFFVYKSKGDIIYKLIKGLLSKNILTNETWLIIDNGIIILIEETKTPEKLEELLNKLESTGLLYNLETWKLINKGLLEINKRIEFEETEGRDVTKLSVRYDVFFIHQFMDTRYRPSDNNAVVDTRNLDISKELDIILGTQASISVSTVKRGSKQRLWTEFDDDFRQTRGPYGVIITRGKVKAGLTGDMNAIARGLHNRETRRDDYNNKEIYSAINSIKEAITAESRSTGYNELIIDYPEIVGVSKRIDYETYNLILKHEGKDLDFINSNFMYENSKKGYPFFILTPDNRVRQVYAINSDKKTFRVTHELTPKELVALRKINAHAFTKEKRKSAINRILNVIKSMKLTQSDKEEINEIEGNLVFSH